MPIMEVGDINLYYEVHGNGEPVVMIQGFACNSALWYRQLPVLARKYRLITLDNRGTGRSDKPDIPYTMEMMAGDVVGLLDAMEIGEAHFYGFSMGGSIAQHLALRYPHRTISLVLACTSCGGRHAIPADKEVVSIFSNVERRARLTPEEILGERLHLLFTKEFVDANPNDVERYISLAAKYWTPLHSYLRQMEASLTHDTYDMLPRINAPTLVNGGALDRQSPLENSRILASRIPNAELAIIENAGHGLFIERAKETNRLVLDFLKRHPKIQVR